eukprot:TRINITY_DN26256_c0_g1_i1.p1 TRINITY_DN26256_c0_g1~~TRINITY_DN26256_c0_g1_i1.p1  ORF type:complete len:737 (+),score=102.04 TRINITY_DN26256_c0_g1_i1:200-2410(+)
MGSLRVVSVHPLRQQAFWKLISVHSLAPSAPGLCKLSRGSCNSFISHFFKSINRECSSRESLSSVVGLTSTSSWVSSLDDHSTNLLVKKSQLTYGEKNGTSGTRSAFKPLSEALVTPLLHEQEPSELLSEGLVGRPAEAEKLTTEDWKVFLQCCETDSPKLRVAVLLSGGVDSSIALRLLLAAGHNCTAYYLKIWFQEDFRNFWSECPWEEDLSYAQAVCDQAGVDLRVVHLTNEYWDRVVATSVEEIVAGRTPNPDILCNSRVKFGAFFEALDFTEFDRVASGHYARVEQMSLEGNDDRVVRLLLSADQVKDQTYFLSHLTQEQLKRTMFPLGCLAKAQVRQLAEDLGLPNQKRPDSQGICFLGKVRFDEFVARHLGEKVGRIVEAESGDVLGTHRGFWFHTVGQRQGLRLSGGPWYVVAKHVERNVVFASRNYFSPEKSRRKFIAGNLSWVSGRPPLLDNTPIRCKVRHGPAFYSCSLILEPSTAVDSNLTKARPKLAGEELLSIFPPRSFTARVTLDSDDQGLAAGQYAAFYHEEECLGAGVILETGDKMEGEGAYPGVSARALQVAEEDWVEESKEPKIGKKKLRRMEREKRLLEAAAADVLVENVGVHTDVGADVDAGLDGNGASHCEDGPGSFLSVSGERRGVPGVEVDGQDSYWEVGGGGVRPQEGEDDRRLETASCGEFEGRDTTLSEVKRSADRLVVGKVVHRDKGKDGMTLHGSAADPTLRPPMEL